MSRTFDNTSPTQDNFDSKLADPEKATQKGRSEKASRANVSTMDAVDDVFKANEDGEGPDYRAVGWVAATVLLTKQQIGLGVLSLPNVLMTLGIVPGLLVLFFLGVVTTYGDYVLGQFRTTYPGCHSVGDIGFIMGGKTGREILGWGYWLFQIFLGSSGILATSIAMNAITEHATCTVAWAAMALVLIALGASQRTFKQISWLGWVGLAGILPAIFIVVIAVGVSDRPPAAPPGPYNKQLKAFNDPTFAQAMGAVVNVIFAYCGTPGFLSVISEMKNPRDYNKAMFCCQIFSMVLYTVVSVVLWYFCGIYVASPALGSAGPLIKKIAYGIAIPGLLAGPIIYIHLAAKFAFVRALRGTHHLQNSTKTHWIVWLSLVTGMSAFAFVISQVIPFFDELIGLIGAVFGSLFCIILMGSMWLYEHDWKRKAGGTSMAYKFQYANAIMMLIIGAFLLVAGLYATVVGINDSFSNGTVGRVFNCADNSGAVTVNPSA